MSEAEVATVGTLIRCYREEMGMTVRDLAQAIGVHYTHIVRLENDERSLWNRPQLARKFIEVLGFERDDRARFCELTGLAALERGQREAEAREDAETEEAEADEDAWALLVAQMTDRRFRAAVTRMRYVGVWAPARLLALLYQMKVSSKWLASAARQAEEDLADSELIPIVLLDAADLFVTVGNLEQAAYYARLSERRTDALLKTASNAKERTRLHMGVARAMLVLQAIARLQNCQTLAWDLHAQAAPHLALAGDDYGWAKTYHSLAWMYFHQGDLGIAEGLALLALEAAQDIEPHYPQTDFWWSLRDGIYLAGSWWRLICLTLLLDIALCKGDSTSARYRQLDAAYRRERRKTVWWAKDLPAQ